MKKSEIRRRRRRIKRRIQILVRLFTFFAILLLICFAGLKLKEKIWDKDKYTEVDASKIGIAQPDIDVQLLTENPYSRPGTKSEKIKGIVIHYTGNPGTTAKQNRSYFENLKDTKERKASSHFVVGLDGEIVQCVPTWEIAYASNDRNADTVSIETCHWTEEGNYTEETYDSLVHLTAWLCQKFDLTEEDLLRHYDVTGKICPKYFVDHEDAWDEFRQDVGKMLEEVES